MTERALKDIALQFGSLDLDRHAFFFDFDGTLAELVDDPANVILQPFAPTGSAGWQLAADLATWLTTDAPTLPGKFGFAVDDAPPVLSDALPSLHLHRTECL